MGRRVLVVASPGDRCPAGRHPVLGRRPGAAALARLIPRGRRPPPRPPVLSRGSPARSGLRRRAARRVHTPAGSPSSRLPGLLHRCGRRRPTLTAAGHRPSPCRVRHTHPRVRRRLRRGRHPGLGPGDADRPVVHRRDRPRPHRSRGRHGTRVRAEAVPPPDVEGGDPGRRPARHLPLRRLLRHRLALLHPPAFLAAVATTFQETSLGGGVATFLLYAAGMGSVLAVLSVAVAIAHRQVVTAMNGSCPTSTGPRANS